MAEYAANFVQKTLATLPGGIGGIVTGALDALAMGHAVGEYVFADDGALSAIAWHDPRRFRFITDAFGTVTGIEVIDAALVLPPERFVRFAYQSRYGSPYGESDLVSAYRAWKHKDIVQQMWLSALDRFGAPTPVARVPTQWQQDEVDSLARLLSRLQNESSLVVPNDVEIATVLDTGARGTGAGVSDGGRMA